MKSQGLKALTNICNMDFIPKNSCGRLFLFLRIGPRSDSHRHTLLFSHKLQEQACAVCYIDPVKQVKKPSKIYIYGRHSLLEALRGAPHAIKNIFLENVEAEKEILDLAANHSIMVKPLGGKETRTVGEEAVHQGVIGVLDPGVLFVGLEDFLSNLDLGANPALAICAEVQDPHNLGTIIRSAAALGLSGVVIPKQRQVSITGAVVKTSVGMVFRVPLIEVGDLEQSLSLLKEKGFRIYGLDMKGEKITDAKFNTPSAFVLGNEASGISESYLKLCDVKLSIPMHERAESLNVAASAAIVFYEWNRQYTSHLI